jgi:hypothetical protein
MMRWPIVLAASCVAVLALLVVGLFLWMKYAENQRNPPRVPGNQELNSTDVEAAPAPPQPPPG